MVVGTRGIALSAVAAVMRSGGDRFCIAAPDLNGFYRNYVWHSSAVTARVVRRTVMLALCFVQINISQIFLLPFNLKRIKLATV